MIKHMVTEKEVKNMSKVLRDGRYFNVYYRNNNGTLRDCNAKITNMYLQKHDRRPLDEEYLLDELYNTILETFKEEGEMND